MDLKNQFKAIISLIKNNKQTLIVNTNDSKIKNFIEKSLQKNFASSVSLTYKPDGSSLKTETIRKIVGDLSTKKTQKHFIFIDQAEKMTLGAQNAFLKVLEEPINQVYFILFTNNPKKLLKTVISRSSVINFNNEIINFENSLKKQHKDITEQEITKLKFITNQNLEIANRMLENSDFYKETEELALDAKTLVSDSTENKLLAARKYFDDREKAISLIKTTVKIYQTILLKNNSPKIKNKISEGLNSIKRLQANGSVKIILLNFVL